MSIPLPLYPTMVYTNMPLYNINEGKCPTPPLRYIPFPEQYHTFCLPERGICPRKNFEKSFNNLLSCALICAIMITVR